MAPAERPDWFVTTVGVTHPEVGPGGADWRQSGALRLAETGIRGSDFSDK
jgi:hypothetical protein